MTDKEQQILSKELNGMAVQVGKMGVSLVGLTASVDDIRKANTEEHGRIFSRLSDVETRVTITETTGARQLGKEEGRKSALSSVGRIAVGVSSIIGGLGLLGGIIYGIARVVAKVNGS